MKTIKIFLASSEELKDERIHLADIVQNLNCKLEKLGITTQLIIWEYLDASMGPKHKQEEYNEALSECDICLVLFWQRFGIFTKTELDLAYQRLREGKNPKKLYVYFKEDGQEMTPELKAFKNSFISGYGHFISRFSSIENLKAEFLLLYIGFLSEYTSNDGLVEIKNSEIYLDGEKYTDLRLAPFAGNNKRYNDLLNEIQMHEKRLSATSPDDVRYDGMVSQLAALKDRQQQMENGLWDTAMMMTRMSSTRCSERLQRAMQFFNEGNSKEADAILNANDIEQEAERNVEQLRLIEAQLRNSINEYQLKINILINEMRDGWVDTVKTLYEKSVALARCQTDQEILADVLIKYAEFLSWQNDFKDIEQIAIEALAIYEGQKRLSDAHRFLGKIYRPMSTLIENYLTEGMYDKAESLLCEVDKLKEKAPAGLKVLFLKQWAILHSYQQKYDLAKKDYDTIFHLLDDLPDFDELVKADLQIKLGHLYNDMERYDEAIDVAQEALVTMSSNGDDDKPLKQSLSNRALRLLAIIYSNKGDFVKAEKYVKQHLKNITEATIDNPQVQIPALVDDYKSLAHIYLENNATKKGLEAINTAKEYITQLYEQYPAQYAKEYADTLFYLAVLHKDYRSTSAAIRCLKEGISTLKNSVTANNDATIKMMADFYHQMGQIYEDDEKYADARNMLSKELDIREKFYKSSASDALSYLDTLSDLGNIYTDEEDFPPAKIYFDEALKGYRQVEKQYGTDTKASQGRTFYNLARWHSAQHDYKKSKTEAQKALKILATATCDTDTLYVSSLIARCHELLGSDALDNEEEAIAVDEFKMACQTYEILFQKNKEKYGDKLAKTALFAGLSLYNNEKLDEALEYAKKARQAALATDDAYYQWLACDLAMDIYLNTAEYEAAIEYASECKDLCLDLMESPSDEYGEKLVDVLYKLAVLFHKTNNAQRIKNIKAAIQSIIDDFDDADDKKIFRNLLRKIDKIK